MSNLNLLAFGAYPYIALAICVIGSWARFDLSQYTWKAGSSQIFNRTAAEQRYMRIASNLFHVGILAVLGGRGNLIIGSVLASGTLDVTSTGGDIEQLAGAVISAGGATRMSASATGARILLAAAGNHFSGGLITADSLPPTSAVVLPPPPPPLPMPTPNTAPPEIALAPVGGPTLQVTADFTPTTAPTPAGSPAQVGSATAAAPAPATSSAGEGSSKPASTSSQATGVSVQLVREASSQEPGLAVVRLPENAVRSNFSFALPERLTEGLPAETPISVSLPDGAPLPAWLRFEPTTSTLRAGNLPEGALPLKVGVVIGDRVTIIEIY